MCRKHHCHVHPLGTNTLMMDPKLKRYYDPKSHYSQTFQPLQIQEAIRRGLSVPARVLPTCPSVGMDLCSVSHKDFIKKPIHTVTKCKEVPNLRTPRATFQDGTSYRADYPPRAFDPNPTAPSLMRSTLPRLVELPPSKGFLTTNQLLLGKWAGQQRCRPKGYKELQEPPFFSGHFQKKSVACEDFSRAALNGGRPGTSCKPENTRHAPEGDFDDTTTHRTTYTQPKTGQKDPPQLRGQSRVAEETMEPALGRMESLTQYREDNPGFEFRTSRRWLCPHPDNLKLFKGRSFVDMSEHRSSYRPRKAVGGENLPTGTLEKNQPDAGLPKGGKIRFDEASGPQDKMTVDNRERAFDGKGVNQTDYFRFSKTTPRVRYGDRCEHVYHPSEKQFDAESETRAKYLALRGKPAEIFKPLDERFHSEAPKYSNRLSELTAYRNNFAPRPHPPRERCPAEVAQRA